MNSNENKSFRPFLELIAPEPRERFTEKMRDEYESGLDATPSRRMERDDPERWEEREEQS